MTKTALITGITGQDGSYLAELLLPRATRCTGWSAARPAFNTGRIDRIYQDPHESHRRLFLHYGDLTDGVSLVNLLHKIQPDEVYNLGALSHVKVSFEMPEYTASTDAVGTVGCWRRSGSGLDCRFYQASTSEMFGATPPPQNEDTPFYPRSPYGAAKVYSHWVTINYREAYGMFAVNGILFNHESPRRGETFVTRKITRAVARIKAGLQDGLYLGNLDAVRDWGYAPEYVEGMWRMLQHDEPTDYVLATGVGHTVRRLRRSRLRPRRAGLGGARPLRRELRAPHRGGRPDRRRVQGRDVLGWKAADARPELAQIMVDADRGAGPRTYGH